MLDDLLDSLDKVDIPATVYRTAVRLLRQADENSMCVLSYEAARELVGTESDGTVRAHLHQLHSVGVLWFRRNEVIRVGFYAQPARAERAIRAPSQQNAGTANTDIDEERALSARNARPANTEPEEDEDGRAPSQQNARPASKTRAERAIRAPSQQLNTNTGRLVGRQDLEPTYLPEGGAGETATQTEPDLPPEQQRTLRFLTDSEFGMDEPTALKLAQKFPFDQVRAHAFSVLDDVRAGKVRSVYVLPARLQRGGQPQITTADRRSGLWQRHCEDEDEDDGYDFGSGTTEAERRRKYLLE